MQPPCYPSSSVAATVIKRPAFEKIYKVVGHQVGCIGIQESTYPYIWDELVVQDDLVFKGLQLVIPAAMRKEVMSVTHSSHIRSV